ncbi:MAG: CYTH domain-containing protein [Desulfomonilia bacterium]|nr:CYTH domain-containing protein [Desulfomonilia bacterium]
MSTEIESKLIIQSDHPASVMKRITNLTGIGSYSICEKHTQIMHDIYLDTHDNRMSSRKEALRLRETREGLWLCFKRAETVCAPGFFERFELERLWSRQNLEEILGIAGLKPSVKRLPRIISRDPLETLAALNLSIIQDRQTSRTLLMLADPTRLGHSIPAEIALDRVSYRIEGGTVLHFEVEVEARDDSAPHHVGAVTCLLKNHYAPNLVPWRHNKLITGFALEHLTRKGVLFVPKDRVTLLSPDAYTTVKSLLAEREHWDRSFF